MMKSIAMFVVAALIMGVSGTGICASNGIALGVEKVTKAPFDMLKGANEHLFTPVKDVNKAALDVTDHARAAIVSVGLNLGQAVE